MFTLLLCLAMPSTAFADPPDGPSLPTEDANPGATRAQAIEAFAKDCHATLKATAWEYEDEKKVPECLARNIEQNCNPDTLGCNSDFDGCQVACEPKCTRCQDTCASSCDDCKGACAADDKACVRKCAETRADCRGRCMTGLRECQGPVCTAASNTCMIDGIKRLESCNSAACDAWVACFQSQDDYEKAEAICKPKAKGLDDFCFRVCQMDQGIPDYYDAANYQPAASEDAKALAKACTAKANCPSDYAQLAPYLGSFCAGTTSDASLELLKKEVELKTISKKSLGLLFNTYGAMYGYEFKQETWMNPFFYTPDAAWLPQACRGKIKSAASAKVMPLRMTRLRDRVKAIWNAAR